MHEEPAIVFSEAEVRQVFRLLSESLTPDDGRAAKVARLMDGLKGLVKCDGWVWVRSRLEPNLKEPINLDFLYGGITSAQMAVIGQRMLNVSGAGSEFAAIGSQLQAGQHFSATRRQLVDDRSWRDDQTMQAVRVAGVDEVMYSWFPFPDGQGNTIWSGAWFFRNSCTEPFDARASRLVHMVMSECAPLHVDGLNLTSEPVLRCLTPKQRLVLHQLIDGKSVKQAAYDLELSPHTVNDHVKAIYRHFDVQSRAELMRYFILGLESELPDG